MKREAGTTWEISCILHAYGTGFEPDLFLKDARFTPDRVIYKDKLKALDEHNAEITDAMHLLIAISHADALSVQVEDTVKFLEFYQDMVKKLRHYPNVEEVCLNFTARREDILLQDSLFSAELYDLTLGNGICLNVFEQTNNCPLYKSPPK